MPDWRDRILKALTPGVARLTLAADPDGLLLEATLLEAVRERGFEILTFEDPVAFRFDYDTHRRARSGGASLRSGASEFDHEMLLGLVDTARSCGTEGRT